MALMKGSLQLLLVTHPNFLHSHAMFFYLIMLFLSQPMSMDHCYLLYYLKDLSIELFPSAFHQLLLFFLCSHYSKKINYCDLRILFVMFLFFPLMHLASPRDPAFALLFDVSFFLLSPLNLEPHEWKIYLTDHLATEQPIVLQYQIYFAKAHG